VQHEAEQAEQPAEQPAAPRKPRAKVKPYEGTSGEIVVVHEDIIRNPFWDARPWLLA
jgi:tRNA(His) guanylyltransferase